LVVLLPYPSPCFFSQRSTKVFSYYVSLHFFHRAAFAPLSRSAGHTDLKGSLLPPRFSGKPDSLSFPFHVFFISLVSRPSLPGTCDRIADILPLSSSFIIRVVRLLYFSPFLVLIPQIRLCLMPITRLGSRSVQSSFIFGLSADTFFSKAHIPSSRFSFCCKKRPMFSPQKPAYVRGPPVFSLYGQTRNHTRPATHLFLTFFLQKGLLPAFKTFFLPFRFS